MSRIKTKKAKQDRSRVRPLAVYMEMIANRIAQGTLDQMKPLGADQLQIGYDTVYSAQSAKKFYIIRVLPAMINQSFFQDVRSACNQKSDYRINVNFVMSSKPHVIDWNSREMKSRRNAWREYEKSNHEMQSDTLFQEQDAKSLEDFDAWRRQSWNYIQDVEARSGTLMDTELIVEIRVADRNSDARRDLKKGCHLFEQYCSRNHILIRKVTDTLIDFMRYTSPASLEDKSLTAKTIANRVIADETLAGMCTYTAGPTSDVGVFMGIDIITGMPIYKSLVRPNGEAENFLVLAETGGGKSYTVKSILTSVRANRFHQIILDVDGEYRALVERMHGIVIDMSKGNGIYFDSVQISDLTGDDKVDSTLYTEAQTATTTVFNALCDPENGMTTTEEKLFSDAYTIMLKMSGVVPEDPSTWSRSKGLTYFHLYETIKALASRKEYAVYGEVMREFIDKLCVFFEPEGLRSYMFKHPISINEILDQHKQQPMTIDIVLNLDSSSNSSKRNSIETVLKQITATYLTTLLTNYFKSLGEFTVHYIEEFQRYASQASVSDLILYMVTGNRKRNAATFIITNSPRALIEGVSTQCRAVVDNINNYVIGTMKSTTVNSVCNTFGLQNCESILHEMSQNEQYKHVFLVKLNNRDAALMRQSIPKHISDTPLFMTRNVVKRDDEEGA